MSLLDALTVYGPLGIWVAFSVVRERWLLKKMEELSMRFENERRRWDSERIRWMRVLGRKGIIGDETVLDITSDREY